MTTSELPAEEVQGPERRRRHRRKPLWKRRVFWVAVIATILAIGIVFWLLTGPSLFRIEID